MRRHRAWLGLLVALVVGAAGASAQKSTFGVVGDDEYTPDGSENVAYDGRIHFIRLSYAYPTGGFGRRARLAPWAHDHPRADRHYMKIIEELTNAKVRTEGSNTFALDDPRLAQFPFAYMSEPGYWNASESEVLGFRAYLLKGGFVVFDDFRGRDWDNLQVQMRRVLPELRFMELTGEDLLFHAFFEIPDPHVLKAPYGDLPPSYWGIFEENDRTKRLLAVANVNNDVGEYWEFSDTGFVPVDLSNEAYKFGVNYAIYALTH